VDVALIAQTQPYSCRSSPCPLLINLANSRKLSSQPAHFIAILAPSAVLTPFNASPTSMLGPFCGPVLSLRFPARLPPHVP